MVSISLVRNSCPNGTMHPARRPEVKGGAATSVERRTGRLPETSKIDDLRQVGFLTDRQLA